MFKSPSSDQIPAEVIQTGSEILRSKIHKLINSIWNMEKLPHQWKQPIIIAVHNKSDETKCRYYRVISKLSTSYKMFSNIHL
jgi:hypothetical protein